MRFLFAQPLGLRSIILLSLLMVLDLLLRTAAEVLLFLVLSQLERSP